ncbi:MAG: hypothetical protein AABZ44_02505 [Elusimicrobiota bacterium]
MRRPTRAIIYRHGLCVLRPWYLPAIWLIVGAAPYAWAIGIDTQISGRQTYFLSKTLLDNDRYTFSKTRLQARLQTPARSPLRLETELHLLYYGGSYLETTEWRDMVSPALQGHSAIEWETKWADAPRAQARARVYRLVLSHEDVTGRWQVGRMRNSFGNTRVFISPLDRFDDLSVQVSDELERPGSDALRWRLDLGDRVVGDVGYLWGARTGQHRSFARVGVTAAAGIEVALLGGRLETMSDGFGASLSKSVADGELRWEGVRLRKTRTESSLVMVGPIPTLIESWVKHDFSRHIFSWERAYAHDWVIALEWLHNGAGQADAEAYDLTRLLRREDLYLGRRYLGCSFKKTLDALWSLQVEGVSNIGDGSFAWYPKLRFLSAHSKLEASLAPVAFFGPSVSEYGRLPGTHHMSLIYYF